MTSTVHLDSHFLTSVKPPAFVECEGTILRRGKNLIFARGMLKVDDSDVFEAPKWPRARRIFFSATPQYSVLHSTSFAQAAEIGGFPETVVKIAPETVRGRKNRMHPDTLKYNALQEPDYRKVCDFLAQEIDKNLAGAENKIWHSHPVWFLDGNPTVGYSRQKPGIRLMFWSGADFEEAGLNVVGKKFKDASIFYNEATEVKKSDLRRWLKKAREIQWDYKNLIRRKGRLERL